jgi:hypothetical protein
LLIASDVNLNIVFFISLEVLIDIIIQLKREVHKEILAILFFEGLLPVLDVITRWNRHLNSSKVHAIKL